MYYARRNLWELHLLNVMAWVIRFHIIVYFLLWCMPVYAQQLDSFLTDADQAYRSNNYALAQEKFISLVQQSEKVKDDRLYIKSTIGLARCYYFLNDHPSAFKWTYAALYRSEQQTIDSLKIHPNYFLGALYIEEGNVDSARKYSYRSIRLSQPYHDHASISQTYSTLAELHMNTSRIIDTVNAMIDSAEHYAKLAKDDSKLAFAYSKRYNLAFYMKKNYKEALHYVTLSEQLFQKTGNPESLLNAYRAKAECLIMLRDTSARSYMWKWFSFKDSILKADKAQYIAKYETLYETKKKEQENESLKESNTVHRLMSLIILFALLLSIVIGLWYINQLNLKKKEKELQLLQRIQKDKERIARDLHDHVGGQLSFVVHALPGFQEDDKAKRNVLIQEIADAVRSIIAGLRETIWAISDDNISIINFSDKLKVYAKNLFKHSETTIKFKEDIRINRELNALLGLNMYRICQEVLHNALKHAQASEIHISIVSNEAGLSIRLEDNGVGFDVESNQQETYGLENIRNRAEEFGLKLNTSSTLNKGTSYEIVFND